jgi:hypothetical protein
MKLTQQVSFLVSDFMIKKLPCDLTSNAGLALVGQYVKRLGISGRVDAKFAVGVGGIANSDILKRSLGLLVQGKNDFDAIEACRQDDFFKRSLGIGAVPSSPTMRQRMNTHAAYNLEGWTTTLPARFSCGDIIALYRDHGTHEQFHSEFKTDMDLERLPSGKFETNYLVVPEKFIFSSAPSFWTQP